MTESLESIYVRPLDVLKAFTASNGHSSSDDTKTRLIATVLFYNAKLLRDSDKKYIKDPDFNNLYMLSKNSQTISKLYDIAKSKGVFDEKANFLDTIRRIIDDKTKGKIIQVSPKPPMSPPIIIPSSPSPVKPSSPPPVSPPVTKSRVNRPESPKVITSVTNDQLGDLQCFYKENQQLTGDILSALSSNGGEVIKYDICSSSINKCYKTLELYKTRVSVVNSRYKWVENIAKLTSSLGISANVEKVGKCSNHNGDNIMYILMNRFTGPKLSDQKNFNEQEFVNAMELFYIAHINKIGIQAGKELGVRNFIYNQENGFLHMYININDIGITLMNIASPQKLYSTGIDLITSMGSKVYPYGEGNESLWNDFVSYLETVLYSWIYEKYSNVQINRMIFGVDQ